MNLQLVKNSSYMFYTYIIQTHRERERERKRLNNKLLLLHVNLFFFQDINM